MSMTPGGITRTVALWVLIVCGAGSGVLAFLRGEHFLGLWIAGLFVAVIMDEIRGVVLKQKTISTQWTDWLKRDPYFAYPATFLLLIGLVALPVHFIFR